VFDTWDVIGASGLLAAAHTPVPDREAAERLLDRWADPDLRVVLMASLALARHPAYIDLTVPALLVMAADRHQVLAQHALWMFRELMPQAVPALMHRYLSFPEERRQICAAFRFLGPAAAAAIDVLDLDDPAAVSAVTAIRGPWPDAPEVPLPYLGEAVVLDHRDEVPTAEELGLDLWFERLEADADLCDDRLFERAAWGGDELHWPRNVYQPDAIVLGAPRVELQTYRFDTGDGRIASVSMEALGPEGFTAAQLLREVYRVYIEHSHGGYRKFEGLRRQPGGAYYIDTGS